MARATGCSRCRGTTSTNGTNDNHRYRGQALRAINSSRGVNTQSQRVIVHPQVVPLLKNHKHSQAWRRPPQWITGA